MLLFKNSICKNILNNKKIIELQNLNIIKKI